MSFSPTTPPSCQLRNTAHRRPTYRMEDGDQETLVHALSMGLRRSRDAADVDDLTTSPKISIASSPFSPFSSQRYYDMRDSSRSSDQHYRTNMANILDAALNISNEIHVEHMRLQPNLLQSQTSVGSISSTGSDETEARQ